MKILVTGGAGYIGSHMNITLSAAGHEVCVIDNLVSGKQSALKDHKFYQCDIRDHEQLTQIFSSEDFDAVMHFAGHIEVGESIHNPSKYYDNNVRGTLSLLDCMVEHKVKQLIFSSTAAVYGTPQYSPLDETHPTLPINPYGQTKLIIEHILADYQQAYDLNFICLRYFNAAGADFSNGVGESHNPETHLIPLVLQAASGRRPSISVFGNDYNTKDGTCIRDYIHVKDLCDAHSLALDYLIDDGKSGHFNLGNGQGFSVNEVIETCRQVTGKAIPVDQQTRRAGDPEILVADATRAQSILQWRPQRNQLEEMISDAWQWEQILAKN